MPKVSVLTPLYNTNPVHLREMIESVLSQTFTDFELLLLNDSPENQQLKEIVQSYNDKRIVYYENEINIGISKSRNKLIELARGEYIAVLDHDDISLPDRLKKECEYLDSHPEIGVVSSNIKIKETNKVSNYPTSNRQIKQKLIEGRCVVLHTAAMIRKSVLTDNNIKYEQAYSPCEDYMLWARLLGKTMFYNFKEPLVLYRDHENNTSHKFSEKMSDKSNMINNFLIKEYPYFANSNYTIYIFGFLPLIKKKTSGNKVKYLLFGVIPIFKIIR